MESEYDEDYIESSGGDSLEDEFVLDEIRSEIHSDIETAVSRLHDMAVNRDSAYASEAALELLRIDSSLESLHILINALASSDSYQNLNALENAWSLFKRGKQGDYLAKCIEEVLPSIEQQQRLHMKLRCILTVIYLQLNLIDSAHTQLDSLTREIASVDAVWRDSTRQSILILAVQLCAISAHSSIDDFLALKCSMNELERCSVGGVVLDSSQNQVLNEVKASLAITAHDLERAQHYLAAALNGSENTSSYILFMLISLCLGQSPRQTHLEINATQVRVTNELISAWNSQDTVQLKNILRRFKDEMLSIHTIQLGCAEAIDLAWEVYREQRLVKLLKFYRRIRLSEILSRVQEEFNSLEDLQRTLASMIRNDKLNSYKLNRVDQSLDLTVDAVHSTPARMRNFGEPWSSEDTTNEQDGQVPMPGAYVSLANMDVSSSASQPENRLNDSLAQALNRHRSSVSSRP